MSFFQRVFHYVLNETVVTALANNKMFQQFAVWSNRTAQDIAKRGLNQPELVQRAQVFAETFQQEMKKGLKDVAESVKKAQKK